MSKSILKLAAVAALSFASMSAAVAAPVYGILDVGAAHQTSAPDTIDHAMRVSAGATVGVQATPTVSAEVSRQFLGNRSNAGMTEQARATSLSGLYSYKLTPEVVAVGKLGIAQTDVGGATNTNLVAGVGFDMPVNKKVSVRTMYEVYPHFAGSSDSFQHLSVGAKYTF